MKTITWYKFTKMVRGHTIEEYFYFEDEIYPGGDGVKEECKEWAQGRPGGHRGYYYSHERVDKPPDEVLNEKIKDLTEQIIQNIDDICIINDTLSGKHTNTHKMLEKREREFNEVFHEKE